MSLDLYIIFWIGILGLCLGSFYNVVILRSLSGESIVFPPSKCPKCGHKLYFWHNIPVLSYILLRGKCYFCKEKISIQYPLIEIITMMAFIFTYLKFGISYITAFVLIWLSGLIIMTATDIKERLVDCNIAIIMAVFGLIFNYIKAGWSGILYSALGLIAGILIIEIIARLGFVLVKKRAMGEADTYVAASLGAIAGIKSIIPILMYSFAAAIAFIVPIFLYKKLKSKDFVTFILFLLFLILAGVIEFYIRNIWLVVLLALIGIMLALRLTKQIGRNEINYLPFVPALAIGAILYIFM